MNELGETIVMFRPGEDSDQQRKNPKETSAFLAGSEGSDSFNN